MRADLRGLSQSTVKTFVRSYESIYRALALGPMLAEQGRLAEAQQALDLLKDQELFEFVQRDGASAGNGRLTLTTSEAAWEKSYDDVAGRLTSLGVRRGALLAKLQRSSGRRDRTQSRSRRRVGSRNPIVPGFRGFHGENTASDQGRPQSGIAKVREAEGLMETLRDLGSGTVAIYTILSDEGYRAILITADVQTWFYGQADPRSRFESQDPRLSRSGAEPVGRSAAAGTRALRHSDPGPWRRIWRRAGADHHGLLDGALRYVPMAALV